MKRLLLALPLALAIVAPPALAAFVFRVGDTVYVDGTPQSARGTACRNPDGTWTQVA